MKSSNQLKAGSLLSYVQMAFNVIIGLIYTPVMVNLLGQSEYGLYNTASSTISMLSVLSLGFNTGYIRYYAKYKKEDNKDNIARLNGLFLIIFLIIGLVALACGLFLVGNLDIVFDAGLTAAEYKTATVLMTMLTIRLATSFPATILTSIITAHERFVFLKLVGIINTVVSPLVTLPLLLMGYRSIAMVAVSLALGIAVDIIYTYYVVVVLKQKFVFHDFPKGLFKGIFSYTFFIAVNLIVDQINWNIDKVLLTRYKGTAIVAVYSIGYTLYHYFSMFSTSISSVFTPRIHRIVNDTHDNVVEQRHRLTDLFTRVGRIQFLVLTWVSSGVVFFGESFILLWVGKGYTASYYVAIILILSASIALIQNVGLEIQRALNKHQFRSIVYICMAFINLGLSIILCQMYGAVGSAIGTALSLLVANGLIMNFYYHKRCNVDILYFWRQILRLAVGVIPMISIGFLMNRYLIFDSYLTLIGGISIYSVLYCASMWFIGMNDSEKNLVKNLFTKIRKKNHE